MTGTTQTYYNRITPMIIVVIAWFILSSSSVDRNHSSSSNHPVRGKLVAVTDGPDFDALLLPDSPATENEVPVQHAPFLSTVETTLDSRTRIKLKNAEQVFNTICTDLLRINIQTVYSREYPS